jgi:SNF family Na+-dependent transporter
LKFNVFLAFKNGGGAFLIPYFCVYFLIGTPLYFLELSLGQFTSRGATDAFKMSRMFKGTIDIYLYQDEIYLILGVGWAMAINSFFVTIYYNIIIAWCLFYFFASFRKTLQWSDCGNWWNTELCSNAG